MTCVSNSSKRRKISKEGGGHSKERAVVRQKPPLFSSGGWAQRSLIQTPSRQKQLFLGEESVFVSIAGRGATWMRRWAPVMCVLVGKCSVAVRCSHSLLGGTNGCVTFVQLVLTPLRRHRNFDSTVTCWVLKYQTPKLKKQPKLQKREICWCKWTYEY